MDGIPLLQIGVPLIRSIRWFWDFIHDDAPHDQYQAKRDQLLHAWAASRAETLPPALHYLTNHLIEDRRNWGALRRLIGEAGEAGHARDNRCKWATVKGRPKQKTDSVNSWTMMLRNFYSLKELLVDGTVDK